jgi:peptidoglycan/LPS O-acetylase OafA/YrhL
MRQLSVIAASEDGSALHRIPALDGVRGLAILLVLSYHLASSLTILRVESPVLAGFQFGWCGVDVFFALSGFLITGILLDTRSSRHYFKSFYARRILRIFPLYYGALAIVMLLRALFAGAGVWGDHSALWAPASLLWPTLFLQNAAIAIKGADATGILAHYWSLAVEEHFYLVWPLLVWLAPRRWLTGFALLAVAASISGRFLVLHRGIPIDPVFGITPLRMDGLAIGALAAILLRAYGARSLTRPIAGVLALASMLLVALFVLHPGAYQSDPIIWLFGYPLVATWTAATLLLCCAGGWLARLFSMRVLRWFGKYSFGLYVWHPIVGMLLLHSRLSVIPTDASPLVTVTITAGVFTLYLAVAWASFHLWEKRFLDLKRYVPADTRTATPPWSAELSPAPGH